MAVLFQGRIRPLREDSTDKEEFHGLYTVNIKAIFILIQPFSLCFDTNKKTICKWYNYLLKSLHRRTVVRKIWSQERGLKVAFLFLVNLQNSCDKLQNNWHKLGQGSIYVLLFSCCIYISMTSQIVSSWCRAMTPLSLTLCRDQLHQLLK